MPAKLLRNPAKKSGFESEALRFLEMTLRIEGNFQWKEKIMKA